MTANTVHGILDSVLDPLDSIIEQVQTALLLAARNKLPLPFVRVIELAVTRLTDAHDELLEIATTLDPHRAKPPP